MSENRADRTPGVRLLAARRHELILREVERHGGVRVRELVDMLGVSPMTIRRDIESLAETGQLVRVHGGAAAAPSARDKASADEPGFDAKARRQYGEKTAIATAAAKTIKPGSAIGITAGTTTAQLAGELATIDDLLVVTNSMPVAEVLHQSRRSDLAVLVTGGTPTPSRALVGPMAEASLSSLHLDQLFMGVHGMTDPTGFTSPNLLEAQTLRSFVAASESVVVLADHTKWGTVGLSTIAPLSTADVLVTDSLIAEDALGVLHSEIGEVVVAEGT
jgi:DeoR/GlpR family transcriptional regulator of sugar metabolism